MSKVIEDLAKWGPQSSGPVVDLQFSERYAWQLATSHYENFPVVSWLVPKPLRQHFANVYAYCRWADDLGDESGSPEESLKLLNWWRSELTRCYQGEASHPVFVGLRRTIEQFSIPIDPFAALISAFEQDQTVREYDTFEQLLDYCRRSADPVGRIVLHLIGQPNAEQLAWSDSICTGLQLANFWQDVARDLDIGRIYLPKEDLERFDVSIDELRAKRSTAHFRELMEFEVARTEDLLNSGQPLAKSLTGRWRVVIELFRQGGLLVSRAIQSLDYDVLTTRPTIRKWQFVIPALKALKNG